MHVVTPLEAPAELAQVPAVITPMDMLDRAVANGAGVDMIEKLMGLQERWEKSQSRKAFNEAITAAKADIPVIIANREGHNKKRYADFAAFAKVVDPIISQHGLGYRFRTKQDDKSITVTCVLFHRQGHEEETTLSGPADATGSKNAIQAIGSTLTYLQRYALKQALGLAASEDDDGKAAAGKERITQEQADDLRDLLDSKGADRKKFLAWAGVEQLEDIAADVYQSCVDAVKQYKNK